MKFGFVPRKSLGVVIALALGPLPGCGGDGMMDRGDMMGPVSGRGGSVMTSIVPGGNAVGVSPSGTLTMRFSQPMLAEMERYVDLHEGDLGGPVVPIDCGWDASRTTLTCVPSSSLKPGTRYALHLGGAMMDAGGYPVDFDQYGPGMGGQWAFAGPMGQLHGGMPWSMMGSWRGGNGAYGMVFFFTTA